MNTIIKKLIIIHILVTMVSLSVYPKAKSQSELNNELLLYARHGLPSKAIEILTKGASINAQNTNKDSALALAAGNGHLETVKILLSDKDINVNLGGQHYFPLLNAAGNNHTKIVKLLLAHKDINVNLAGLYSFPLFEAVRNNHIETIKLLLAHKDININLKTKDSSSLLKAVYNGHIKIVKLLLAHKNINVNIINNINIIGIDNFDNTFSIISPLFEAIYGGHTEIIKLLLAHKNIDLNKQRYGNTALSILQSSNKFEIATKLKLIKLIKTKGAKSITSINISNIPTSIKKGNTHQFVIDIVPADTGLQPHWKVYCNYNSSITQNGLYTAPINNIEHEKKVTIYVQIAGHTKYMDIQLVN